MNGSDGPTMGDLAYAAANTNKTHIHYLMLVAYWNLLCADVENFQTMHPGDPVPTDLVNRYKSISEEMLDRQWVVRRYFGESA